MKNSLMIKKLVGIAILTALVVVFQLLSNYIKIGTVSITLALFPIAMGAILYGPLAGLLLGMVMGAMVLVAPDTQTYFFSVNPVATIALCLIKSGVAGLVSGFVYKGIAYFAGIQPEIKKERTLTIVAIVVATIIIPIINTFIFVCGACLFFTSVYPNGFMATLMAVFGTNFVIELAINVVLSPVAITILKIITRNYNLGFDNDFEALNAGEDDIDIKELHTEA